MISKILSTAVKVYLRSQVERAADLQVRIDGKNKQIIQGYIPQVLLSSSKAVYRGLHLSQVKLNGTNLAFNLPEVIQKKPLKLLEPLYVAIQLKLDAADLRASLDSPLLQSGLNDLWQKILSANHTCHTASKLNNLEVEWYDVALGDRILHLAGVSNLDGEVRQIRLSTKINLADEHTLCLSDLTIDDRSLASKLQNETKIDLGTDVAIAQLKIESEWIICSGKIRING